MDELRWSGNGIEIALGLLRADCIATPSNLERFATALAEVSMIERGECVNCDEDRQVGHYWLRSPELAPPGVGEEIAAVLDELVEFADSCRAATTPTGTRKWTDVLVIGIGGSSLGARFVSSALPRRDPASGLQLHFLDNTDPDGARLHFEEIGDRLRNTIVLVVSKSGSTPETLNGLEMARARFAAAGLSLPAQTVGVSMSGSKLHQLAEKEGFWRHFPVWDWVGGRTSIMSPSGLLPLALHGVDVRQFLDGAEEMDRATRSPEMLCNPAALLAFGLYELCCCETVRHLVVVPYRDRLSGMAPYLQQLIMESLGKERDRAGRKVNSGLCVFGNKGSTDQHSYFQHLRDGRDDSVVFFVESLLEPSVDDDVDLGGGIKVSDYLFSFLHGSRLALIERGRNAILLSVDETDERAIGRIIALFERTVSILAHLLDVNAYWQPGVEAGKRTADLILSLQSKLLVGEPPTDARMAALVARLKRRMQLNGR